MNHLNKTICTLVASLAVLGTTRQAFADSEADLAKKSRNRTIILSFL